MNKLVLLAFSAALLFALPFANAACFSEGHVKVLELGECIQTDNGYKIVLSDVSGYPQNSTNPIPATFKIYDAYGNLIETAVLYPCTAQFCGAYYTTQHGLSIDLINAFAGIGQTAYADVYARSWTQYKEFMPIGGEASFPGLRIRLADISGFPTNASFPQATFRAYDSQGNLLKQFVLQRGLATQTQAIEDVTNGVLTHLLVAFAGIGQTAYVNAGFKIINATPTPIPTVNATPTPIPTVNATPIPCSNDVYAQCADGYAYLKSRCVNGVLTPVQYFADPCLKHGAKPTVTPTPSGKEKFTLTLKKGWNMLSTPITGIPAGPNLPAFSPGATITSTTCSPAKLLHYETGGYTQYGTLVAGSKVFGVGGFWANVAEDCEVELSALQKNSDSVSLQPGWNQIGAFYEQTVFNELESDCRVLSGPWHYNAFSKRYEKASVLEPGKGYFVKVASECTLGESLPPLPELPPGLA